MLLGAAEPLADDIIEESLDVALGVAPMLLSVAVDAALMALESVAVTFSLVLLLRVHPAIAMPAMAARMTRVEAIEVLGVGMEHLRLTPPKHTKA